MALKAGRDQDGQQRRNPADKRELRTKRGSRTTRRQGTKSRTFKRMGRSR